MGPNKFELKRIIQKDRRDNQYTKNIWILMEFLFLLVQIDVLLKIKWALYDHQHTTDQVRHSDTLTRGIQW